MGEGKGREQRGRRECKGGREVEEVRKERREVPRL